MGIRLKTIRKQSLNVILNITQNLILMAGHAGNFRKIDEGRKIAKRTNQKEYEIYKNPGGLQDIIPYTERTNQDNQEIRNMGKNVIVMQNMFYGIQKHSLVALDIKIGKSTASRSQLSTSREKNRIGTFFKKIKMSLYDRYTKSSTRGWRAIPIEDGNRAKIGRNSEIFLREQFDKINAGKDVTLRKIIIQLNLIKEKLNQNQKTFIASSVLIVIDLQHPKNAHAKLIDLAYPIDVNSKLYQRYKENFDEGITALINFLEAYAVKQEKINKNE
ncbi:inositol polyphosphate kinase family protein [Methanosarcina sp. UBA411]|jgi:hypothetical protein|uniref:inositol polyphosphate kinase family protein n=1 Tax=Methanosarcina sp. UBA411 TaxID=1915589 RepID=UPI0025F2D4A1|nr:inositol polyphosphate kinase family protein [Methanosarcina sp. UBA411]